MAQPTAQVSTPPFLAGNPLQYHERLAVKRGHMKAAHNIRVLLQRHPGRHLPFKRPPQPLPSGQIALLKRLQRIGIVLLQIQAQIHLPHAPH